MRRVSQRIMMVALVLVLFQFLAPAFFPMVVQEIPQADAKYFHVQHSSIVAPLLLKENDERELEEVVSIPALSALLDLTVHGFNLTASHTGKNRYFTDEQHYNPQPALFTRYCTFLI
jgi:hypothetical protein